MAKTKIPPAPRWDLESIFPGGSKSAEFKDHRQKVKDNLEKTGETIKKLPPVLDNANMGQWVDFVLNMQSLVEDIELIISFANCLASQDVKDSAADAIYSEGYLLYSKWEKLSTELEALSLKQTDEMWGKLVTDKKLDEVKFYLNEKRDIAKSKMPLKQESLALDLAVDGYHAWNQIYNKMAGELKVDFKQDGKVESISMGQLATKFSDPDRAVRQQGPPSFQTPTALSVSRLSKK